MDRNGIGLSILSLTQPGIEGITDSRKAVEMARRMNDHSAERVIAPFGAHQPESRLATQLSTDAFTTWVLSRPRR